MTNSDAFPAPRRAAMPALPLAYTILRAGAALCFIGHGAFGFITKAAWLPYFAVAGIPPAAAFQLMPWIGAADMLAAVTGLVAPRRAAVVYMVAWATWTALLRPFSGEPVFEAFERAGNYGVPLAFLMLGGGVLPLSVSRMFAPIGEPLTDHRTIGRACIVLQWTTCLLLAGHGVLGIQGKAALTAHYAAVGLPETTTSLAGWFELALAAVIAVRPGVTVLAFVAAWKVATESLFLVAGDPLWEFVERAGSYAAPLALAVLFADRSFTRRHGRRPDNPPAGSST